MLSDSENRAKDRVVTEKKVISAIDVGSNAMRMLLADYHQSQAGIRNLKKFRVPLRLGQEVFGQGYISPALLEATVDAFHEFSKINRDHHVTYCRAVATSACREASNRANLVDAIFRETGIKLEIIDGIEEARLVHLAVSRKIKTHDKAVMLVDIGGGSVEVSFANCGTIVSTKSIELGTVRILNELARRKLNSNNVNIVIGEHLESLRNHLHPNCDQIHPALAVGTGGNLECLGGLRKNLLNAGSSKFFYLDELEEMIQVLSALSLRERINKLQLRPDRADVILPAAMVLHVIMRQAEIRKIIIPGVGLRDGLIWNILESEFYSTNKDC